MIGNVARQVLVVDDVQSDREPLKSALEGLGVSVRCAEDLDSAQRELEHHHFDLVVTDLAFPAIRGQCFLDFTRHSFARTVSARGIPLVVVSHMNNLEFASELANTQRLMGLLRKDGLTRDSFKHFIQNRFGWSCAVPGQWRRTWLHISDLHFGLEENALFDRKTVERAFFSDVERVASQIDIVFVTGDIAFSGRPEEYAEARRFINDLRALLDRSVRVYVVPGNHDKERPKIAPVLREIRVDSRDGAMRLQGNRHMMSMATEPFGAYAAFVKEVMGPDVALREDLGFAHVDEKTGIGINGLNSALASDHSRNGKGDTMDHGSLFIGEQIAEEGLDHLASKCALLITLMHHPFAYLADFDRDDLQNCLIRHHSMLLHGHLHKADFSSLDSLQGRMNVAPCGSLYQGRQWINSYNVGRVDLDSATMVVTYRRYSDVQRTFIKDLDTTGEARDGQFCTLLDAGPSSA
jgi:CheY-like chemotaxis protein/UDP-2,3-diacylglucosamine pyrophosphatase LpxH